MDEEQKARIKEANKGFKLKLWRHKEPELALDLSKGFTMTFFCDMEELGSLVYEPDKEET